MKSQHIVHFSEQISEERLRKFCQKWKICELSLFGSALRKDFSPESDIDVLVGFCENAHWSLFDHLRMEQELKELFQREVDLISRRAVEQSTNWIRRNEILKNSHVLFSMQKATHVSG